jgi:hypothetical protein
MAVSKPSPSAGSPKLSELFKNMNVNPEKLAGMLSHVPTKPPADKNAIG